MAQLDFSSHNRPVNSTPVSSTNLFIFNKAVAAYKLWHDWLKNFPKHSRYALGFRTDQIFLDLLELLFTAGYLPKGKKLEPAAKSIGKIDLLKFYLRLCWEMTLLSDNKFQILGVKMDEIGRLAWSWKNNLEKTSSPEAKMQN